MPASGGRSGLLDTTTGDDMMNRTAPLAVALTLGLAVVATPPLAAGPGAGTGPMTDLYAGTCESLSGTLMELGSAGSGALIDTGADVVTVYGLGPARYWDELGVAMPTVGEAVGVDLCWITFSDGTAKAIATAVSVADATVVLRDPVTGQPLWRGAGNGVQAAAGGGGQVRAGAGSGRAR
jgi:hypothetical protein